MGIINWLFTMMDRNHERRRLEAQQRLKELGRLENGSAANRLRRQAKKAQGIRKTVSKARSPEA